MQKRLLGLLIFVVCMTGCTATPDLSKWAEESATMQEAVAKSQKNILDKIEESKFYFDSAKKEEWDSEKKEKRKKFGAAVKIKWDERKDNFAKQVAVIDASMTIMVLYSNALSNLAAAGETGKDASESILTSTKSILSTVGAVYPAGTAIANGVEALLSAVSDIVTKIEAQDALADTMTLMQPAIDKLAASVTDASAALEGLVNPIYQLHVHGIKGRYGPHRIRYYKQKNAYIHMEELFLDANKAASDLAKSKAAANVGDIDKATAAAAAAAAKITDTLSSLEQIRDVMRSYEEDLQTLKKWRKETRAQLLGLKKLGPAWASTHKAAATLLDECGGLHSLRPVCGNLTIANLKLARSKFETVVDAFSPSEDVDDGK